MCRNIKTLFNFEPPATHAEIHASALQFVRKLSGFNSPSQANAEAFNRAVSKSPIAPAAAAGARPRDRSREGGNASGGASGQAGVLVALGWAEPANPRADFRVRTAG